MRRALTLTEEDLKLTLNEFKVELLEEFKKIRQSDKDHWDKLAGISPIVSGFLVMLGAIICTYQYNQEMVRLQEASTIERFIPHLLEDDRSQKMAILALHDLVSTEVAAKYAEIYASDGTVSALNQIAAQGNKSERKIAQKALDATKSRLEELQNYEKEETRLIGIVAEAAANPIVTDQRVDVLIGKLADLYLKRGNRKAAIPLLKLAMGDLEKYDPSDAHARQMREKLVKALKEDGRFKEAQKYSQEKDGK